MSAEKGPKHIYAEEHQLYYYYYNFEEHLVQKQEHFATSETRMTRWLRPAGSNMLEPAKMFIRAWIIRHNARQSYNNNESCNGFARVINLCTFPSQRMWKINICKTNKYTTGELFL